MKITLTGLSILLITPVIHADDITENDPMVLQTRTQMQNRLQSMNSEDRDLYQQLNGTANTNRYGQGNGSGKGSGDKKRLKDGSGNGSGKKNRFGQSAGGYGSGFGSRQGAGQGRR
jgi:flavodoxin